MADDLASRVLQQYAAQPDLTTSNVMGYYRPAAASPRDKPEGKGERLRRAWQEFLARGAADMTRKAERPWVGETHPHPLPWPLNKILIPFPAKDSDAAELGRTALMAPLGARLGMGSNYGSSGFGGRASEMLESEPAAYHIPGGLGLGEMPWSPGATQPREILGRTVAAPLALTKRDTSPMADSDLAEKAWEKRRLDYPLRDQLARIANDFWERPGHHLLEGAKQGPMMTGYTPFGEIGPIWRALSYLPLLARAEEAPIPGSILDPPAYSRFARPRER